MQTSFNSQTLHGVLAQTSLSPVCTESELCYIGVVAKLAPASLRGLIQTPHKLARTGAEYMGESKDLQQIIHVG